MRDVIHLRVSAREFHTVIAALRYYQAQGQGESDNRSSMLEDLARNLGQVLPLTTDDSWELSIAKMNRKRYETDQLLPPLDGHGFAAAASAQALQDRERDTVRDEAHRAVGEAEVGAPHVPAAPSIEALVHNRLAAGPIQHKEQRDDSNPKEPCPSTSRGLTRRRCGSQRAARRKNELVRAFRSPAC